MNIPEADPEDDDLKNESKDGDRMPEFGSPEMRNLFYLGDGKADRGTIFINHGSYGTTPKSVMEKRLAKALIVYNSIESVTYHYSSC